MFCIYYWPFLSIEFLYDPTCNKTTDSKRSRSVNTDTMCLLSFLREKKYYGEYHTAIDIFFSFVAMNENCFRIH